MAATRTKVSAVKATAIIAASQPQASTRPTPQKIAAVTLAMIILAAVHLTLSINTLNYGITTSGFKFITIIFNKSISRESVRVLTKFLGPVIIWRDNKHLFTLS